MTAGATMEGNGMPSAANVELLLGVPGQSSLPMWLKPDMFLAPTFDPEACVADLRRFAPLSTLQTELQAYLATLKAKMVEVINEDYQDYVNLSAKLVNVDGAVMRMRKPLLELKDKLGVVAEAVRGELSALGAGLRKRKEVAMARSLLELLQELAHVASKVEKLLAEVTGAEGVAADVDTRSRLLERLAGEVSRLSFQANRGKDLAFVRAMEPRIAAARSTLQEALSEALTAALESKQHTPALHCLHAYAELGLTEQAEDALRRLVVGPIVRRVIIDHKSTHTIRASAAAASGAREDVLGSVLRGVEKEVVAAAGPLLTAALTPQSPLRVFDFLGNVLLAEVDAQLSSNMPAVFSPGVPPAFHANYLAAQAFLESLEARCLGRTAMDRLRASPAYAAFNKQWNTSVYFSLFYQEVAGEVEDAAAAGKPDLGPALTTRASGGGGGGGAGSGGGSSGAPGGVVLPLSSAVIKGLGRCASPAVFLQTLADKFLKLALQLGQRYVSWAAAAVAARQAQASTGQAGTGLRKVPSATGVAGATPGDDSTAASSGEAAASEGLASPGSGGPAAPGAAWVASLALDDLACLYGDLVAVAAHVRGVFAPAFTGLLGNLPEEVVVGVRQGIEDVADQIEAQGGSLLTVMSDEVAEACVGLVRQLKGITATYRMTTKGPPTRHSHYVASVLGPLKQLLEGPRVSKLPQAAQQQLAAAVVNIVTGRYQVLAEELLNTVRKTESSLKRLKKVQQTDAGDASGLSDSDKITLQLYLDVHEYAQQVSRFGLTPATIPSYAGLLQAVTPPPAVLAAVGQPPAH